MVGICNGCRVNCAINSQNRNICGNTAAYFRFINSLRNFWFHPDGPFCWPSTNASQNEGPLYLMCVGIVKENAIVVFACI